MNKEKVFKFIFICFGLCFIVILLIESSGYYQTKETKTKLLTEEQIKMFEEDISQGKDVDITDYIVENETDYSSELSNNIYKISLKVEKTIDKMIKYVFKEAAKAVND